MFKILTRYFLIYNIYLGILTFKNYQNDLKREGQIHKLQQNHSENLYQNSLTDMRAKQRIQSQKQENALKNAVEDARYERGQLIRDYEVKLGNRPD